MKLLVVGDLHGAIPRISTTAVDALIAPGDFCSDEAKQYMFAALRERLSGTAKPRQWYDIAGRRKARQLIQQSLAAGRNVLTHLNSVGVPVYVVPGNWDWTGNPKADWLPERNNYFPQLTRGLTNIIDVHKRSVHHGDFAIIGHGITAGPELPQDTASFTAKQLQAKQRSYDKQLSSVSALFESTAKQTLFLTHNVPYNTSLDMITDKQSPRYGQHFGSLLARDLVLAHRPVLCIGGHMHEHFGKTKLGSTVCINAGYGPRVNTYIELTGGKIRTLEFRT